jgi:uncharacterized membrane protein YtjA (UPF0391 family)
LGNLLYWAVAFLVVAIVAALFGFGGVAGTAIEGAKILFWVALVLFVLTLVFNFMGAGAVDYRMDRGAPIKSAGSLR